MGNNSQERKFKIGDVYHMDFSGEGSAQRGWRPGLVFQNNVGNSFSPNLVALPLTSSIKKMNQPTHVYLYADEAGLPRDSMVLCENPVCIPKSKVGGYITSLTGEQMAQVASANLLASGAVAFISPDALMVVWKKAHALNGMKPCSTTA